MSSIYKENKPMWIYPENNPVLIQKIIAEFNIHPVTAQILVSRGLIELEDIHNFLYAKLPQLHSPNLFQDMEKAIGRIILALKKKESILIYGDNDVDGMTAAALLTDFFYKMGIKVFFYIPNREDLKKSMIGDALKYSLQKNCTLMITVDCGITAAKEIENIIKHNIDVIITDHHEPTSKIPHCIATLNPKLIDSTYPNRDLTGVGVAFKVAHGVLNYLSEQNEITSQAIDLKEFLDLVALGTIADMGALRGENRILVRYGIEILKKTKRIGLKKLFEICELDSANLSPVEIASKVAPRLNSLGRIADPIKGVELLLCKDEQKAQNLAKELDLYNIERQKIERQASENVEMMLQENPSLLDNKGIILYSDKWHPGIIAIISARIAKQYNRPTIILAIEKKVGKGSIRTIPEFPLLGFLKRNEKFFTNYGGHDFAAGITIQKENIEAFKQNFINEANKALQDHDIINKLFLDARIDFQDLTFDFMESMRLLEPYGNENPPPLLYSDAIQTWPPKVIGKIHLKMFLEQKDRLLEGIGFGMAEKKPLLRKKNIPLRVIFTPHINIFLNKSSIQLHIKDFKSSDMLKTRYVE